MHINIHLNPTVYSLEPVETGRAIENNNLCFLKKLSCQEQSIQQVKMKRHLFVRVDTPARPVPTCSFFFFSAPKKECLYMAPRVRREREKWEE